MLQRILDSLQNGCKTIQSLSAELGICERQVYRYLREAKISGRVVKVLPGVYRLSDCNLPSFEDYLLNLSGFEDRVSKNKQHNKTSHNDFKFVSKCHINDQKSKEKSIIGYSRSNLSLKETVCLILSIAQLDYSEFELKLAMNKIKDVHWHLITQANASELVVEARERFVCALEKYSNIEYPIPYFFGIIRRMLISSFMKQSQEDYRQFVMEFQQPVAVGAEEIRKPAVQSVDDKVEANYVVPSEWSSVKKFLKLIADEHSIRCVSDFHINRVIRYLVNEGHYPERVQSAFNYLKDNDFDGASYFCEKINSLSIVEEVINKNWRRYKKSMRTDQGSERNKVSNKKRDERYGNFYELFPDG